MKNSKQYLKLFVLVLIMILSSRLSAQDPNFHIYLSFGQSNMEGQGDIEEQDETVDSRFQVYQAVQCSELRRTKGAWYTAEPPTCRCSTGLSPVDYFGRTMVKVLPDSIKVGIINVSVAGCKIELFDKDGYQDYVSSVTEDWLKNIINAYDGNPYSYLLDLAQQSQQDGVIKGILLHQGESNTGDSQWPAKVKKVYEDLLADLELDAESVPLLVGEVVHSDQGGVCASMNSIIGTLPRTIPNSYVISSSGCPDQSDNLHFNSEGYRILGTRYAVQMLSLLGYDVDEDGNPVNDSNSKWVGTWSTAPYAAGTNTPPSPFLANNTLRQIVRVSIGGDTLRIKFSNITSPTPVTFNSVNIAVSTDPGSSVIDASTIAQLTFNGNPSITMNAYSEVTSDPLAFPLTPGIPLAITIYYGQCETSADMTHHYGSRTDSYILVGDQTASADFTGATTVERWYNLSSIDVLAPDTAASVAVLGNSITDGYGGHGGPNNRWTQFFSDKLLENPATSHVGVLNMGIGGTLVSTSGLARFQSDILEQSGLRWIIVFYGVNDIGGNLSAENVINAFKSMISQAHARNIRIYGATITPFKGHYYYSDSHESVRLEVNEWIRTPGNFDKIIDFDKALRDPADTAKMQDVYTNDYLHPNAAGYQFLGEFVDVDLFLGADTLYEQSATSDNESHYYEPECGVVGSNWEIVNDSQVSNDKYVTVKSGIESLEQAPTDSASTIYIPFEIDTTDYFNVYVRINCPTYDDDSYWAKVDDGEFEMYNGLVTSGWQWIKLNDFDLTEGAHMFTITFREDGARLDKICISNDPTPPAGLGEEAENLCVPTDVETEPASPQKFGLKQNYPNPFNPTTRIDYTIVGDSNVTIIVYDMLGREVSTLLQEPQKAGRHSLTFDAGSLASGIYYYQMIAGNFIDTKKFLLLK